ncbi:MAG: ribosomal protein S18-alanine N-acetyltransferase [Candidatus Bathyarchaeia archaeon]|jgi:ribosomal-protein-alanine N-acetyltransferase|nr:ribosomal protein S18-alanine N-acetyltransferase [Candidatus Bathyarchaeota archaeon A05DMB-4]MDH7595930.1 ribosomal protein S18-alanine N-acetyltransferase [Candidatus Bathyarchaeota archaeon]
MTITIQKATLTHLEALYKIEQQCFTQEAFSKNQIAWLLKSPVAVSFLAKENNEIVGFIIGVIYENGEKPVGRIFTIDVAPAHRRKGVGIRLLKRAEKEFADLGVKICYLEVRADNVAAKQLYKKVGYKEIRVLKDYYFQGGHGIRLKKAL